MGLEPRCVNTEDWGRLPPHPARVHVVGSHLRRGFPENLLWGPAQAMLLATLTHRAVLGLGLPSEAERLGAP